MKQVENVLHSISEVYKHYQECHHDDVEPYNIFSVIEVSEREVIICRFLADLLNPKGNHHQGIKYLKPFLEDVLQVKNVTEELLNHTYVFKEYPITDDRRIDLVIRNNEFFIPIEVKINAGEQKSQCFDYYQFAIIQDSNTKVVYLTKYGNYPSEYSLTSADGSLLDEKYIYPISFQDDIRLWLENIVKKEIGVMKIMIQQYLQVINDFTSIQDKELSMIISDKILENEDYFRASLMVANTINNTKAGLIYKVLEEFEKQMLPLLDKYRLEPENRFSWYVYQQEATEEFYTSRDGTTWPGINYVVKNAKLPEDIELWLRIEVNNNLFAGLCLFDPKKESEFGLGDQQDDITDTLKSELLQYMNVNRIEDDGWWAIWRYLPTGTNNINMNKESVPNFKEMNEAAIKLSDNSNRIKFVEDSIKMIEACLLKLLS